MYLFFEKRVGLGLLLLVLFTFLSINTEAQYAKGMTGQLSDQQLIQLWQKTQKEGMSESDVMKVLVQKGLSVNEVDEIKKRIINLQANNPSKFSKKNIIKDTSNFLRDTTWIFEVPAIKKSTKFMASISLIIPILILLPILI
jgi:hypothetical protein